MEVSTLKWILLLAMILITIVAGLFPVRLLKLLRKRAAHAQTTGKQRTVSLVLCLLTCFSGGVFLGTCFIHLFPELLEHLETMKANYHYDLNYPVAELLSCLGFFLLFFLEELVLKLIPSLGHGHSHGTGTGNADLCDHSQMEHRHAHDQHKLYHQHSTIETVDQSDRLLLNSARSPAENGRVETPVNTARNCASSAECIERRPLRQSFHSHSSQYGSISNVSDCSGYGIALAEPERCETDCEKIDEHPPILMKSRPHAHSHGVRSITFVLAISIHSVIEGLAFGVQKETGEVAALFISLMVHKVIVAFSVGLQLARTHAHAIRWVIASVCILAIMTPLGALLGMFVQSAPIDMEVKDIIILIFQGLAVGTFLYVTFFEVLLHERDNEHPNMLKLLMMMLGFALIALVRLVDTNHGHSHGSLPANGTVHDHNHEHHDH